MIIRYWAPIDIIETLDAESGLSDAGREAVSELKRAREDHAVYAEDLRICLAQCEAALTAMNTDGRFDKLIRTILQRT